MKWMMGKGNKNYKTSSRGRSNPKTIEAICKDLTLQKTVGPAL